MRRSRPALASSAFDTCLDTNQATLKEVVETLASLERRAGSQAERQAAEWIAERIERAGTPARVEEEQFYDGYARELLPLGVAGSWPAPSRSAGVGEDSPQCLAPLRPRRSLTTLRMERASGGGCLVAVSRPGTWSPPRATVRPPGRWSCSPTTTPRPPARCSIRHFQRWLARRFPELIQRTDTPSLPLWWPVVGGPALVAVGALTGSRAVARAGAALSALTSPLGLDNRPRSRRTGGQ